MKDRLDPSARVRRPGKQEFVSASDLPELRFFLGLPLPTPCAECNSTKGFFYRRDAERGTTWSHTCPTCGCMYKVDDESVRAGNPVPLLVGRLKHVSVTCPYCSSDEVVEYKIGIQATTPPDVTVPCERCERKFTVIGKTLGWHAPVIADLRIVNAELRARVVSLERQLATQKSEFDRTRNANHV